MIDSLKKNKTLTGLLCLGLLFPVLVFASTATFRDIVHTLMLEVIHPLVMLLVSLSIVFFIWGVAKYILHGGDEAKRKEGINMIIYGIIAIFAIVSVWGLVEVLQNTIFGTSTPVSPPPSGGSIWI